MKTLVTTLIILISIVSNAQSTYLKFKVDDKESKYIMYPPGTKFEVVSKEGYIQMKNTNNPYKLEIENEGFKLYAYPNYKTEKDVYHLEKGAYLELVLSKPYNNHKSKISNNKNKSTNITAKKTVTNSKNKKGRKNLVLKFTNGITFKYTDGKIEATLNDKDIYVEGKYVLYCKLGVAKISFNPKNGETWWVFDKDKE
ncbi:hypothetical protein [Polaribacter dokdonensis]|uniref:Uncharacterized protein n=1 Tax=Polaribacter dokdonensis DSW-5 TaxID=1300348 RepID=A0A0N0UN66_9FLAO|nr:hypothetical protein [Polaribacter dokdonensis]KOY50798.1 hypothetical protein I602_358 [Polaribacter dokdonensis DSW-5]SEE25824.1 hypothetical protein SAMN05444353_1427 [Polaribacter dokdonensis DSW-5]